MKPEPDQPIACNLGSTGQLVRRALSPVSCPERFREDLRRRLIDGPPAAHLLLNQESTPRAAPWAC
jgi:hypothetical protein